MFWDEEDSCSSRAYDNYREEMDRIRDERIRLYEEERDAKIALYEAERECRIAEYDRQRLEKELEEDRERRRQEMQDSIDMIKHDARAVAGFFRKVWGNAVHGKDSKYLGQRLLEELSFAEGIRWWKMPNSKKMLRFIERGAALDMTDKEGKTALHWMVIRRRAEDPVFDVMLSKCKKSDLDFMMEDRDATVLMTAASIGAVIAMEKLLKAGANPRLANSKGETAYTLAKIAGKSESMALLEKYMPDAPKTTGLNL